MRLLIILILVVVLSGCAKVTVKTDGNQWEVTYSVLMRKLEGLDAKVNDSVSVTLGSTGNDVPISNELIACMLAPHLCQ